MIAPTVIVPWLLMLALKASLVVGAAFLASLLLRRASAASRHVVWLSAFVGVLALPVAMAFLPALRVPLFERLPAWFGPLTSEPVVTFDRSEPLERARLSVAVAEAAAAQSITEVAKAKAEADLLAVASSRLAAEHAATAERLSQLDIARAELAQLEAWSHGPPAPPVIHIDESMTPVWPLRLFLLWVFGCVMVAVAFAVGVLRTHIVACAALPVHGDDLADEIEVLSAELGIVRDVRLVTWPGPAMPMTWGARRPVVLLPESAREWPEDRRRDVLTHELAHVRRGDWIARLIAAAACAIYWFNPLVWMAARRMRYEQELACDDTVLAGGVQPSDYAAHLLDVAKSLRVPSFAMANASVAMARPSQLTGRLLAVLDESRTRVASAPRRTVGLAWLVCVPLVASVGAAAPWYSNTPGHEAEVPVAFAFSDDAPPVPPAPPVEAVPPVPAAGVPGGVSWNVPDARTAVAVPTQGRCEELLRGGTRRGARSSSARRGSSSSSWSSGGPDVATTSSSSGGRSGTNVTSHDDDRTKRVTMSVTEGECQIEVRMVGTVRLADDESDVLDVSRDGFVRVTQEGGGPERRFDLSWRTGRLERHWRVDGSETPESAELRAWLAMALQTTMMRTGYNAVPRALRAYRAGGLDSALQLAEATGSDYSRRIILMALLDSVRVPQAEAARIARQAESMSSDYERAELLIAVSRKLALDGPVQEAMVSAANGMSSDYERRRVLTAALAREGLSAAATAGLLRSAAGMSSDYEKTELLLTLLRNRGLSDELQVPFFEATNTISSDYEHRRALAAVLERPGLSVASVRAICAQAMRMASDYERAELLVQVVRRYGSNADARTHITRAVESFSSDYERDRVLAQLGRLTR